MKATIEQPITIGSYQAAELPPPPPPPEPLVTEREVCDFLRIKPRQLFAWRREGFIPYIKIGKALRFRVVGHRAGAGGDDDREAGIGARGWKP